VVFSLGGGQTPNTKPRHFDVDSNSLKLACRYCTRWVDSHTGHEFCVLSKVRTYTVRNTHRVALRMDAFHCCIKKSTNETLMDSVWKAPQGTYGNALHPTCSKHDSAQYLMLIEMNIIVLIPKSKYICELGLLVQYEDTGQINYLPSCWG